MTDEQMMIAFFVSVLVITVWVAAVNKKREKKEIGIHAVRGGTIVGKHDVMFIAQDEIITIAHEAQSRAVFAKGAIRAAKFIAGLKPGMYNMQDLVKSL